MDRWTDGRIDRLLHGIKRDNLSVLKVGWMGEGMDGWMDGRKQ